MIENGITWLGRLWDFIDKRDIDKHTVSVFVMILSWKLTAWAMVFADGNPNKSGIEIAATIAAVLTPWSAVQTAALSFYFKSRPTS